MDLSIIIPCHNLEKHIGKCVDTLVSQKTDNYKIELVFILDNCTDSTRMIIEDKLCMPDTYNIDYQMIECSVGSAGLARNKGLGVAKGKYIWFVDGDDWLNGDRAFIDILNAFRDHPQVDTITFGFSSQGWFWETNEFLSRFVYSRKVIGDIKFVEDMPCEGFQFVRDVRKNQKRQAVMNYRYYHFNFPREGSVSSGKIM